MTGFPTVVRQAVLGHGLRRWSIAALVLGTLLGGTALAVAGTDKSSDEYGEMGTSPIPVVSPVTGPTSFRVELVQHPRLRPHRPRRHQEGATPTARSA